MNVRFYQHALRMFSGQKSTLSVVGKMSDRLFPMRGLAVAAAILFIIGTAGFLSIEYLKQSTEMVVHDTLAGLRDSSLANANLVETFNKTLLMVMAGSDAEREHYRHEFENYDKQISQSVTAYSESIFTAEDRTNYTRLLKCRKEFLIVHQRIDKSVQTGEYAEALKLFKSSLFPVYRDYKLTAEKVMKYNSDEGKQRGEVILQICVVTQFLIAGAGIALFMLGFFLGFFK